MGLFQHLRIPRLALSLLLLVGAVASMAIPTSPALALCATTGTAPSDVTLTCSGAVVTDGTTNSTSPNPNTVSSTRTFNANLIGNVQAGATISGNGLLLITTAANGGINFTNNGTITGGSPEVQLQGNGGNVSYTGTGNLTGTTGNNPGTQILNNAIGTGTTSFTSVGGSITTNGGPSYGVILNSSATGGISFTTSGGHTMFFGNTTSGQSITGIEKATLRPAATRWSIPDPP